MITNSKIRRPEHQRIDRQWRVRDKLRTLAFDYSQSDGLLRQLHIGDNGVSAEELISQLRDVFDVQA